MAESPAGFWEQNLPVLKKASGSFPVGLNKDGCSPECSDSLLRTRRVPSLSVRLTLRLADGKGRKKGLVTKGMEPVGRSTLEAAMHGSFSSHSQPHPYCSGQYIQE